MDIAVLLITGVACAACSAALTKFICASGEKIRLLEKDKERETAAAEYESKINAKNSEIALLKELHQSAMVEMKTSHQSAMVEMKESQERQMKAMMDKMRVETEAILKQRSQELSQGNKSDIDGILRPLKESMDAMREAMKKNAESHIRNTVELSKQLEQAVREMEQKTADIGQKADNLSEALTSRPKVQGCFGENFLDAMLAAEGLVKGVHYSKEAANDDRSRPDFVFHFKEGLEQKDLVVDSKVSLTAFVDYVNAADEQNRREALASHLKSVRKHIDELAAKDYARKTKDSFADYVLMFMPVSGALQVAMDEEPMLWRDAYSKGVLITTEQTIMPFLKIIQLTWKKYSHDTNLLEITKAAENMIERVGAFYDLYRDLGSKLKSVCTAYDSGVKKLKDSGPSITTSARQVMEIGIRRRAGKAFTVPEELLAPDTLPSDETEE